MPQNALITTEGECIPEPQTFRGRETQSSDGGSLLLRPWEDAHGGLNTRTGRRGNPEGRGFDGALVSTTMYSRPSSLPATTREDPRPCLLPALGSGRRTADKPPPARTTPRSLASSFRRRHTRGPWCPSLPPPILLPAPALAHPIPPVRHATSSRKSAWTAGDYASLVCVSTTSTASGEGPRGCCRSPLRAALPPAAGTTRGEERQRATSLHHGPACTPPLEGEKRQCSHSPLPAPTPPPALTL